MTNFATALREQCQRYESRPVGQSRHLKTSVRVPAGSHAIRPTSGSQSVRVAARFPEGCAAPWQRSRRFPKRDALEGAPVVDWQRDAVLDKSAGAKCGSVIFRDGMINPVPRTRAAACLATSRRVPSWRTPRHIWAYRPITRVDYPMPFPYNITNRKNRWRPTWHSLL